MEIRTPDPPLSDGAVTLRPWTLDDVAAIARACNEREIARWIHQMPSPYGEQDAHEYVLATQAGWREGTGGFFAIVDAATAEPVGSIAIHVIDPVFGNVEVGYWTAAEARGRGLTTRALRLISRWAIEVEGWTWTRPPASIPCSPRSIRPSVPIVSATRFSFPGAKK